MEIPKILERYKDYLQSSVKLSNRIIFTEEDTKPWESKLGGCPYLEDTEDYPKDEDGRPMMFLAQINLTEMPPLPNFPKKGILQFYIKDSDLYGLDENCSVKYIADYRTDETTLIKKNPYRCSYESFEPFSTDCKITFVQEEMFIETSCQEFEDTFEDVTAEENDALFDLCCTGESRVGGYPYFVQQAPAYYEDDDIDVLLLQLDVDDTSGLMFGDSGNCNFLISQKELDKLDFSLVEYDWQCC